MSRTGSPSTNKPYGVARVAGVWPVARSSFYAARLRQLRPRQPGKRGPRVLSDAELVAAIRELLAAPVFAGEGYRKIWARLRHNSVRTSKDRVLRLLREDQLLSPARQPQPGHPNPHDGTIVTEAPDQMWGTDATATCTEQEGAVTVFAAIDHFTAECVGIHAVKKATRFEALEPIRQGVRERFGAFSATSASGLCLRHDHGSVSMSDDFQERDPVRWHRIVARFRPAAGRKRMHRALLSHLERAATLGSAVSRSRRTANRGRRLPRSLQPTLDYRAAGLPHSNSGNTRFPR